MSFTPSGLIATIPQSWDMDKQEYKGIKVGDLITTYHKGFHRLDRIQSRYLTQQDLAYGVYKDCKVGDEYSPMFYYTKVADANGMPTKSKIKTSCDASFCRPISEYIQKEEATLDLIKQLK